jgi:hypothetical protein
MWRRVDLVNWRFGWTYRLHLQGRKIRSRGTSVSSLQSPVDAGSSRADFATLKMEAIRSSETSVRRSSTWGHIPEDGILRYEICCTRIPGTSHTQLKIFGSKETWEGRVIAQAFSRWLSHRCGPGFETGPGHVGFVVGQSGAGTGLLRVLRFPLQSSFAPPITPQSPSCIIRGLHNRPMCVWPQCWDLQGPRGLEQRDLRNLNLGDLKKGPNGGVSSTPQKNHSVKLVG